MNHMKHSHLCRLFTPIVAVSMSLLSPAALAQELNENKPPKQRERNRNASQDGNDDKSSDTLTRAELKERFESRYERLLRWKQQGIVGETFDGWIEAVYEAVLNDEQRDLLAVENADRKALYALIADRVDENGDDKRVPPRIVAERNARRNFDKAEPDERLKVEEGYWIAKSDLAQAKEITRFKKTGDIGETWEGYLGFVATRPSDEMKLLVKNENAERREIYQSVAKRAEKTSAEDVGRSVSKITRDNLQPGQYYQSKNGSWERRPTR
jgi:uncharacterized protein YdbL (DUF1318 family)